MCVSRDGSSTGGTADGVTTRNRGQYSDAVLSELESQNDGELEGMSAKVKMLKDVRTPQPLSFSYPFAFLFPNILSTFLDPSLPIPPTSPASHSTLQA